LEQLGLETNKVGRLVDRVIDIRSGMIGAGAGRG
jgi:hypothetical protein